MHRFKHPIDLVRPIPFGPFEIHQLLGFGEGQDSVLEVSLQERPEVLIEPAERKKVLSAEERDLTDPDRLQSLAKGRWWVLKQVF